MDKKNLEDSAQEQKILSLEQDGKVKDKMLHIGRSNLSKEERVRKVTDILREKGIEYTKEDVDLFDSIIDFAMSKRVLMSDDELKKVSAGKYPEDKALEFKDLPKDIQNKILEKNKWYRFILLLITAGCGAAAVFTGRKIYKLVSDKK